MKSTFYGHFVAGEDANEIRRNVESMRRFGVKSILDYSAEEDLEAAGHNKSVTAEAIKVSSTRKLYDQTELQSEKNLGIFKDCIDIVSSK